MPKTDDRVPRQSLKGYTVRIRNLGPLSDVEFQLGDFTIVGSRNAWGKTFLTTATSSLESLYRVVIQRVVPFYLGGAVAGAALGEGNSRVKSLHEYVARSSSHPKIQQRLKRLLARRDVRRFVGQVGLEPFGTTSSAVVSFGQEAGRMELSEPAFGSIAVEFRQREALGQVRLSDEYIGSSISEFAAVAGSVAFPVPKPGRRLASNARQTGGPSVESLMRFVDAIRIPQSRPVVIPAERIALMPLFLTPAQALSEGNLARLFSLPLQVSASTKPAIRQFAQDCRDEIELLAGRKRGLSKAAVSLIGLTMTPRRGGRVEFLQRGRLVDALLVSSSSSQLGVLCLVAESSRTDSVYVEEPEVNLHPDTTLRVADYLWDLGKQVFLTTHSQDLISHLAHRWREGRQDSARRSIAVFEIRGGTLVPLHIDDKGRVDELEAHAEATDQLLREGRS